MAIKPLKTIKFPELPDTYTIPQVDPTPTQGSNNAVSSGGVYDALAGKVDAETGKGLSTNDYTDAEKQKVTHNTNAVASVTEIGRQSTGVIAQYNQSDEIWTTALGYLTPTGRISGSTSENHGIWFFQTEENLTLYFAAGYESTLSKWNMAVYSSQPFGQTSLVTYVEPGTLPTAESPLTVESGQYLAVSIYNMTNPEKKIFTISILGIVETLILKSTLGLTSQMDSEVSAKISPIQSVVDSLNDGLRNVFGNDGYGVLPASAYSYGGLTGYTTVDNRRYRIHTGELIFQRDVTLLTKVGFEFVVRYADERASGGEHYVETIPANTAFKIYLRRRSEDTSEVADISAWANNLLFSTPISPMERLRHTFTDVSMFERMGIGGDSYAAGGGIISGIRPLTWGKNLERQAGITVDIYAKSGEDVVGWNSDTTNGLPALLAGTECGLYWLAHGINGTSTDETLGTAADMSANPHPDTFYGQYVEAIEQIKAAFPYARIVLQTITGSNRGLYEVAQYSRVNVAIRAIAEYCEVPVIEIMDDAFYNSEFYKDNMRSNHPTAMVAAGMAQANRRLLSKCIMDNEDYFVSYGVRA